jgi:LacI family transcriptional regulator, fructose operon transcriptional repressor
MEAEMSEGGGRKTTIYDLSRVIGASPSTVSAVLNGSWARRRIKPETASEILKAAEAAGYSANLQARGLRVSRSGLIGMIVPLHENRFFGAMSQNFEAQARARGLYPITASTLRDPTEEERTVRQMLAYNIEAVLFTGATDPDALSTLCRAAGVRHVNVDLPGTKAPSVISDNTWGAERLTEAIIGRMSQAQRRAVAHIHFIGGVAADRSTSDRIAGFRRAHQHGLGAVDDSQIDAASYDPDIAEASARTLYRKLGGHLPAGLFVNSTIAFEGVLRFLKTLELGEISRCAIGCYDWDPFASFLHFPVIMVRQRADQLIAEAFRLLEMEQQSPQVLQIRPELVFY